MKRNVLALSIAAMIGGFGLVGGASANVANSPNTDVDATTARILEKNTNGIGHILIVPYFTTQNGNATLINLVNTDTVNAKAVKIRFRGASNSDDIYDFQVFMSPGDVWSANVSSGSDGKSSLTTTDKSCTEPTSVNSSFVDGRLPGTAAEKAAGTREGYVEIFNTADIPPFLPALANAAPTATANPLFTAIKHVNGVAPCKTTTAGAAAFTALETDWNDLVTAGTGARAKGLITPTTGLFANWIIINVPSAAAYGGSAEAIEARVAAGGLPGRGNLVYSPQTNASPGDITAFTSDPTLRQGAVVLSAITVGGAGAPTAVATPVIAAGYYDLPDLSTPYIETAGDVAVATTAQAAALTASLAVKTVSNEYVTETAIAGATDWTFSMPTRRYSVAVDYRVAATPVRVFTDLSVGGLTQDWFVTANTQLVGSQVCVSADSVKTWNREEGSPAGGGTVISPGVPTVLQFCGEASVLSFNSAGTNSVLSGAIARKDLDTGTGFRDGWATINVTNAASTGNGLPVLGQAFTKAGAGAATFGVNYDHRNTR